MIWAASVMLMQSQVPRNYDGRTSTGQLPRDWMGDQNCPRTQIYINDAPDMQDLELTNRIHTWSGMLWSGNPFIIPLSILKEDARNDQGVISIGLIAVRFIAEGQVPSDVESQQTHFGVLPSSRIIPHPEEAHPIGDEPAADLLTLARNGAFHGRTGSPAFETVVSPYFDGMFGHNARLARDEARAEIPMARTVLLQDEATGASTMSWRW